MLISSNVLQLQRNKFYGSYRVSTLSRINIEICFACPQYRNWNSLKVHWFQRSIQTLFDITVRINVICDFPISRISTSLAAGRPVYRIYFRGICLYDYMPILHIPIVADYKKKKKKNIIVRRWKREKERNWLFCLSSRTDIRSIANSTFSDIWFVLTNNQINSAIYSRCNLTSAY